uniref:MARVEL domain-containing protein n=1 Tax=Caenorhabditis tropicalis TaxID=1561998 RepID=A0A1I7UFV4_9PELO
MPLNISRFKKLPELIKIISLLTSLTLLIYLGTIKFRPPGMSVIWFTIGCSIVFDICTIAVLLKEYDVSVMAIRMLPYAAIECVGSILALIFYVISTAISISSEEVTDDFGFMVVAIFCFINALIHVSNLVVNVRRWNNGSHHLNPAGSYEYSNYGADA